MKVVSCVMRGLSVGNGRVTSDGGRGSVDAERRVSGWCMGCEVEPVIGQQAKRAGDGEGAAAAAAAGDSGQTPVALV